MPKRVAGKRLLSTPETNEIIYQAILKGEPFWAGRMGGTEMNMIYEFLKYKYHPEQDKREAATKQLCELSGFFPYDLRKGQEFVDLMLKCCKEIDLQGEWRRYMEDYLYVRYQKNTQLTQLFHLEPWNMYEYPNSTVKPWTVALKGKKVLVIHPFAESIEKQYKEHRERIFGSVYEAEDILPVFELKTIKAVQTLAGEADDRFRDWFEALNWMIEECKKMEFDVAIIGCGAYGYPLAAEIKRMGKIAIHLGGSTQILFGIIGSRWEKEHPEFCRKFVNDAWVRPMDKEKIQNAASVENACYW